MQASKAPMAAIQLKFPELLVNWRPLVCQVLNVCFCADFPKNGQSANHPKVAGRLPTPFRSLK